MAEEFLHRTDPLSLGPVLRPPSVLGPEDQGYRTKCQRTRGVIAIFQQMGFVVSPRRELGRTLSRTVAKLWRKVWQVTRLLIPARRAAFLTAFLQAALVYVMATDRTTAGVS